MKRSKQKWNSDNNRAHSPNRSLQTSFGNYRDRYLARTWVILSFMRYVFYIRAVSKVK